MMSEDEEQCKEVGEKFDKKKQIGTLDQENIPGTHPLKQEYYQNIIQKYLSYQEPSIISQKNHPIIRKPRTSELMLFQVSIMKVGKIMTAAYNGEQLRKSQIRLLQQNFILNKEQVKFINPADPKILQTLRYLVFNKQQIPHSLAKVVDRMAKTHILKESEPSLNLIFKKIMFDIVEEDFQPPLDLYLQFVDNGIIHPTHKQLIEVYTSNQCFFESVQNNKQAYQNKSQKKRLILNQFPYLLDIFDRINVKESKGHTFPRFKLYLDKILLHLQFSNQDELLQRYLPEVKCRYFKIKFHLGCCDVKFLMICLKGIFNLSVEDFKMLYRTKSYQVPIITQHEVNSWLNFCKSLELCQSMLTKKNFHLSEQELQQIGKMINFQKGLSIDVITNNIMVVILRQQSYKGRQFSQSVIQKIIQIFKSIPDKKKKKQLSYILLIQYLHIMDRNPEIVKKDVFPEQQLDDILNEGRCIALDLLLCQEAQTLTFQQDELLTYVGIIKNMISRTKSKTLRRKSILLLRKLSKLNNFQHKDLSFYEENIVANNQLIQLVQIQMQNGQKIGQQGIFNAYQILKSSQIPHIRKSCICTLKYYIRNKNGDYKIPELFLRDLLKYISQFYFQQKLSEECRVQILSLAIQSTNLNHTHIIIDILLSLFFKAYVKSTSNSILNVNSSYGIYALALSLKHQNEMRRMNFQLIKEQMFKFLNRIQKNYKSIFIPNSRSNLNILCAISVMAQNRLPLPCLLTERLTNFALNYRDFTELFLLPVYLNIQNSRYVSYQQEMLINICQILNQEQESILGMNILQKYFEKQKHLSYRVVIFINKLQKISKNERLCFLCKQMLRSFVPEQNLIMRKSGIPVSQFKMGHNQSSKW